jgi:hypothetical protein
MREARLCQLARWLTKDSPCSSGLDGGQGEIVPSIRCGCEEGPATGLPL